MNYNLPLLHEAAVRFSFTVDVRGPWPVMIQGLRASEYRTHRDMLNFISVRQEYWEYINRLNRQIASMPNCEN